MKSTRPPSPVQYLPKDEPATELKFSEAQFWGLLAKGSIVDGRQGGLVVCPDSRPKGMALLFRFRNEYFIQSHVQNGEFILTASAYSLHWRRICQLEAVGEPASEVLSDFIPTIDCAKWEGIEYILTTISQVAIARRITAEHLGELIRLNYDAAKSDRYS